MWPPHIIPTGNCGFSNIRRIINNRNDPGLPSLAVCESTSPRVCSRMFPSVFSYALLSYFSTLFSSWVDLASICFILFFLFVRRPLDFSVATRTEPIYVSGASVRWFHFIFLVWGVFEELQLWCVFCCFIFPDVFFQSSAIIRICPVITNWIFGDELIIMWEQHQQQLPEGNKLSFIHSLGRTHSYDV